jgi:hypothetical protein
MNRQIHEGNVSIIHVYIGDIIMHNIDLPEYMSNIPWNMSEFHYKLFN